MSMDTSNVLRNANANGTGPSRDNALVQPFSASQGILFTIINLLLLLRKILTCHIFGGVGAVATNNCPRSIESPSGTWPASEAVEQENVVPPLHGEHSLQHHALCKFTLTFALAIQPLPRCDDLR